MEKLGLINSWPPNTMRDQHSIATPIGEIRITAESNGEVSLASGELPRSIANGMSIDNSIACILTVHPHHETTDIRFCAELLGSAVEGSPHTGQDLDCLEWESTEWQLTLGTEDQEILASRLPDLCISEDPYPIEYTTSSMVLTLNRVPMRKTTTFQFIVSYKKLPDERECSAWFFADVSHEVANKAVNPSGGSGGIGWIYVCAMVR
jgi:hypothetical protein